MRSIFAIHSAIFIVMFKALKLAAANESVWQCAAHLSACAASAKGAEPAMASYPVVSRPGDRRLGAVSRMVRRSCPHVDTSGAIELRAWQAIGPSMIGD